MEPYDVPLRAKASSQRENCFELLLWDVALVLFPVGMICVYEMGANTVLCGI